jgi:hypothetical protein
MDKLKSQDLKQKQLEQIKENTKTDMSSMFKQIAEIKKADPKQKMIQSVRENVAKDISNLFAQLENKTVESEQIEELLEQVEALEELAPIEVKTPEERSIGVEKYLLSLPKDSHSYQDPIEQPVSKELTAITNKLKFLEQWVGKISAAGPGSGEVNLRYLDDIDRSTIANGLYLRYNSTKKKFEFAAVEDIDYPAQIQSDWTQADNTRLDYIKHKPTIPDAQIQSDWNQTDNTKPDFIKNKPEDNDTAYLTEEVDTLDSVTDRGNTTTNEITVAALNIPVGSVLTGTSPIIANITAENLNAVLEHGDSAALDIGDYGLTNGITGVPYAVYELKEVPSPALQVNDIIGGAAIPVLSKILFVGSGIYNKIIITDKNFAVGATPPPENTVITFARPIVNAGLAISTASNTDIVLNAGPGGHIVPHSDIIPYTTNVWSLGTPGKRFKEIWMGAGTIYVQDETLGNDQALGAKAGNFYIKGGAGFEVGEFVLRDNTLQIKDSARDVYIGSIGATADVVFNRAIKVQTTVGRESFSVARSGLATITTPDTLLTTQSALNIIGSSTGAQYPRNFTGTLLQLTGQDGQSTRVSMDTFGGSTNTYALIAGRAARGTVDAPTATQSGDTLFRISVQGYGTTGFVSSIGRIALAAKQTFTDSAAGTEVVFQTTPLNSTTIGTSAKIDDTGLVLTGTTNVNSGVTFRDGSRLKYFPSTTGKAGYLLKTDGTDFFWAPETVIEGSVVFKGEWNASTNTPSVSNATGTDGWQYIVSVAGTQNLGNGSVAYTVGDQIIHDGTKYIRIPAQSAHVQSNWTETNTSAAGYILNKPTLFSGNYNDLTNKPTIPAAQLQSDWNQTNNLSLDFIKNKPTLFSGNYNDLTNKPTLFSGNYNDLTNKPTIPAEYTLPTATTSVLGGVKVDGTSITISSGVISATPTTVDAFSSLVTTQITTLAVDMTTGPSVIFWQPSANGNRAITLSNFTAGRRVKIFIMPHTANNIFTFTGVTTSQCSNNKNTFALGGGGVAQDSMMIEVFSTTTAIGGVWIFGFGSQ